MQVNKEIEDFYQTISSSNTTGNNNTSVYEHNQKIDGFFSGSKYSTIKYGDMKIDMEIWNKVSSKR